MSFSRYSTTDTVCAILPTSAVEDFGITVTGSGAALSENPACFVTGGGVREVRLFTTTDRLTQAYEMNRPGAGTYPHFIEALTIGGQPAAHVQPNEVDITARCVVVVALSDTASFEVEGAHKDSCPRADRLATAIVEKLAAE